MGSFLSTRFARHNVSVSGWAGQDNELRSNVTRWFSAMLGDFREWHNEDMLLLCHDFQGGRSAMLGFPRMASLSTMSFERNLSIWFSFLFVIFGQVFFSLHVFSMYSSRSLSGTLHCCYRLCWGGSRSMFMRGSFCNAMDYLSNAMSCQPRWLDMVIACGTSNQIGDC